MKWNKHIIILTIAILCAYANIANGPFIFDDDTFIVKNTYIHSLDDIPRLYRSCITEGAFISDCNFYRPNQALVHAIVYKFFGANPIPFHVTSILFHLINCLLIYKLLQLLTFSKNTSFFCSLLFAIHPMQTEAVSYISGLSDPLALCFMLMAIITAIKSEKQKLWIAVSIISGIMALLSKESAITLMFLIPTVLFIYNPKPISEFNNWSKLLSVLFVLFSIIYLILKFTIFDFTGNNGLTGAQNVYTESLLIRLITFISIIPEYLKIIFVPFKLYIERPYTAYDTIFTLSGIIGLLTVSLIFYFIYRAWQNKQYKTVAGFLWVIICMAPLSGIIPLNAIYLEHWLYIPSVGLIILLANLIDNKRKQEKVGVLNYAFIAVAALFCIRTYARNDQWKDPIKFYANEIKNNPKSARCYNNLAMAYADKKEHYKSIEYYLKAIQLYDIYPQTHHNLGNVYLAVGDHQKAYDQFFTAIYMDPGFVYSYEKLILLLDQYGQKQKAGILNQMLIKASQRMPPTKEEIKALYEMK